MPERLADAETLRDALLLLRLRYRSWDALAAELGTSRQRVYAWRDDGVIPEDNYQEKLAALGVPARVFQKVTPDALRRRLAAVEAEVDEIRKLLP